MEKLVTAIVTDTPDFRAGVENCLSKGFNGAVCFETLEQLKSEFESEPPQHNICCVVLDMSSLPDNYGDTLFHLKRKDQVKYVPFIGVSHKNDTEFLSHFFHILDREKIDHHLLNTVEAAYHEYKRYQSLINEVKVRSSAIGLIQSGDFRLRTLQEAEALTTMLSLTCPDPSLVALGLSEILVNAIEHGNLNISYNEKSQLLENGEWEYEINRRLSDSEYKDRYVKIELHRTDEIIQFVVTDQGNGFDWKSFVNAEQEQSTAKHGRGIAIAIAMGFNHLEYNDKGNQVTATIHLTGKN